MSETAGYALDQPLPSAAVLGGLQGWFGYRRFPVFSGPWLLRRSLLFLLPIAALALLTALGTWVASRDATVALASGGILLLSFGLMSSTGPAFATLVRHRRLPLRRERLMVVLAVLLGVLVSYVVDRWASAQLEPVVEQRMQAAGSLPQPAVERARAGERSLLGKAVNLLVVGGIYFLLGGGLALRGYFREQRLVSDSRREAELAALRLEGQQSAMRLSLLQAQIAPHFLFNTLASIRALLRQDAQRAEATLDALVDHLRACMPRLDGDAAHHATVGEQVEICRSYLELMRLRTGGRLDYAVRCPQDLADEPFLPLLLLTLVENAVKHGVEPHPGPVTVTVEARREANGQLCLCVEDSGAGLQPGLGKGVGLANVRAQLASRYGEAAKLRVQPREGGGVRAEIRLPATTGAA